MGAPPLCSHLPSSNPSSCLRALGPAMTGQHHVHSDVPQSSMLVACMQGALLHTACTPAKSMTACQAPHTHPLSCACTHDTIPTDPMPLVFPKPSPRTHAHRRWMACCPGTSTTWSEQQRQPWMRAASPQQPQLRALVPLGQAGWQGRQWCCRWWAAQQAPAGWGLARAQPAPGRWAGPAMAVTEGMLLGYAALRWNGAAMGWGLWGWARVRCLNAGLGRLRSILLHACCAGVDCVALRCALDCCLAGGSWLN